MQKKTKSAIDLGVRVVLMLGAFMADVILALPPLMSAATFWWVFHFVWMDLDIRRKYLSRLSIRKRMIVYTSVIVLVWSSLSFYWGNVLAKSRHEKHSSERVTSLQEQMQVLRDDNDRLRDQVSESNKNSTAPEISIVTKNVSEQIGLPPALDSIRDELKTPIGEVFNRLRELTSIEKSKAEDEYLGRWTSASGKVSDIQTYDDGELVFLVVKIDKPISGSFGAAFSGTEKDKVLELKKGNWATVRGQIYKIDGYSFNLKHSILTESKESPPEPESVDVEPEVVQAEILEVPIIQLMSGLKDLLSYQVEEATAPHTGKWLTVSGSVTDIALRNEKVYVTITLPEREHASAQGTFSLSSVDGAKQLTKGATATFKGNIRTFNYYSVYLENCLLEPAQVTPTQTP